MNHSAEPVFEDKYISISTEVKKHHGWFMVIGSILVLLGIAAIAFPFISTLAVELFIGWIFLISGAVGVVSAFRAARWKGFLLALLSGLLAVAVGILLLFFPLPGVLSLTLLVAAFFIAAGVTRIFLAFRLRPLDHWGWYLFNGVIALIVAGLILSQWPQAAAWVIGLLIGIDLIFSGTTLIMLAAAARRADRS